MYNFLRVLLFLALIFAPWQGLWAIPLSVTITENISFGLLMIGDPLAVEADDKVEVSVTGDADTEYSIQLAPLELTEPGGNKIIVNFTHDAATPPTLDGAGLNSFFITATIPAGQLLGKAAGNYSGTAVLTVVYP